ncbi:hypothetical protein XF_1767 [Xylella fastidiosa 9a5c]|uniref:Uncharacterized protein n=1 Tax=Xylella fastidiosa (strain 9a5c) TaxID=160492 RepID=Q9PCL1_XYLFA|nr:hypothetical protein XF_1767 [Xylella fastidiosa 9a5c]
MYCSSVTFSIHVTFLPSTVPVTARCVIAVPDAAPCQCLTPGGHQTTSPGRMTCTGLPHSCTSPTPEVTTRRCPAGWVCQAERAPGSKLTRPPEALMFLSAGQTGSTRTRPVKNSAGPVAEACSPARVICCALSAAPAWGSAARAKPLFKKAAHKATLRRERMGCPFLVVGGVRSAARRPGEVLLVGDVLQPLDVLAIERFLDRDVGHGRVGRGAVPVPVARRAPDDVAGADFDDRLAFALRPAAARGDDQRLPQRVRVPGRARARLEGDGGAGHAGRRRRGVQRVDANRAGEPLDRSFDGRLRSSAFEFHGGSFQGWGLGCEQPRSQRRSTRERAKTAGNIVRMKLYGVPHWLRRS